MKTAAHTAVSVALADKGVGRVGVLLSATSLVVAGLRFVLPALGLGAALSITHRFLRGVQ